MNKAKYLDKNKIRALAIEELTARGCKVWRQTFIHVTRRTFMCPLGAGDVSGISPQGLRVECEIKTLGDKIGPNQREFMKMIKERGGIALLATEEEGKLVIKEFPV